MMKKFQGQLVLFTLIILLAIFAVAVIGLGAVLSVIALSVSYLTYYPAAAIDWVINKVKGKK